LLPFGLLREIGTVDGGHVSSVVLANPRIELLYPLPGLDFPFERSVRDSDLGLRASFCSGELVQVDRGLGLGDNGGGEDCGGGASHARPEEAAVV
jgi:hypothetical protein